MTETTKWEKKDPVNGRYIWDFSVIKDILMNPVYNRTVEGLCLLHQAQRLAVAVRGRHSEVADNVVLGVLALLLSDDRHGHTVLPGKHGDIPGYVP